MQHHTTLLRRLRILCIASGMLMLGACSTLDRGEPPTIERQASWVVLPFANHTETPLAGNRAEAIALALLHAQGVGKVQRYESTAQQEALFDTADSKRQQDALEWARERKARYALAGAARSAWMVSLLLALPCRSSMWRPATFCGVVPVARAAGAVKHFRQ